MKNKNLSEKAFPAGLFILALLMLFNPNINILDILPDFIGYLIIARLLLNAARRVPFFEEARSGFFKLALVSFAKYPAFMLMVLIRGQNTLDNDVIALFSFTFAIIELLLAVGTINNLFAGISYLASRTGKRSIIGEKPTAEGLRILTLVFTCFKCAAYSLPEFLLLTSSGDAGSPTSFMPVARFYPVVLLCAQVLGYAIGIAWVAFLARYLTALKRSGEFYPAVMELTNTEKELAIAHSIKKTKLLKGLKLLPFAALLSFDFTLTNIGGANILPHTIIGILLLFAISSMTLKKDKLYFATLILGGVYSVFSVVVWLFGIDYHDSYSYVDIILYDEADKAFSALAVLSMIETLLFVAFSVLITLLILRFIKMHTGKTPPNITDPLTDGDCSKTAYSVFDKRYHRSLAIKAWIFFAFGIVSAAAKLFRVFSNNERSFSYGAFIPTIAPWIRSLTVIISILWAVYTLYFTGILSEDLKIKYSEDKIDHKERESQYF